jgi:signal peptidase I
MMTSRSRLRSVLQVAALAASAFTARASFADHYRVPSGSMEPTVRVGDHIVVAKAAYGLRLPMTDDWLVRFHGPARGDVVVLEPPKGDELADRDPDLLGAVLLKRVVAVAGDEVAVRDGHVLVGGRPVREPWASVDQGSGPDFGPVRVPDGKLLVLGDNRGNSRDGRYFGWIDRAQVLGRAVAVVSRDGSLVYDPL